MTELLPAAARRRAHRGLLALGAAALLFSALYLVLFVNPRHAAFAMSLRLPRLAGIVLAAAAISAASVVFQTLIRNRIVTPCLLGMNGLYVLIHTAVVFAFGSASLFATDRLAAFALDTVIMGCAAGFIYWTLFVRTGGNVLYVLLIGTVLATLFTSIQGTLVRMMDPNDYDALLTALVASFTSVNSAVLVPAALLLALLAWALRRDLALLDVLALGPESAVSLGVDYRGAVMRLMVGVALAIAAATAVVGPLSFLGLITANIAREATGTFRHAVLVPASILAGIAVLAAGELAVEQAMNFAVPVSVFVTLLGGSYFLWLILRAKETEL